MKILVSDYDKTFYKNEENIKKNILYVENFREKGNIFVIASGRSYKSFMSVVKKYHIKYDYAILNYGSIIIDNKNNILYEFCIEDNIVKSLEDKNVLKYKSSVEFKNYNILKKHNVLKISLTYKDDTNIKTVFKKLYENYKNDVNMYLTSHLKIEIVSKHVNKSNAIKILINYLNVDKNNVYTIGDNYSDIDMIKDYNGFIIKGSIKELEKLPYKKFDSVYELIRFILKE